MGIRKEWVVLFQVREPYSFAVPIPATRSFRRSDPGKVSGDSKDRKACTG